ncbi:MAG TPA: PorV/PorQ family protein [Caldithrix abyssi]|uniref:PorV/PorQ family protein n=1 Tax=Caldithrix abyssi TaxID=187145 RepID=A0A7V5H3B2_CALAY|nr:PorV/PorQ family protein [Caldithrix abyssi]
MNLKSVSRIILLLLVFIAVGLSDDYTGLASNLFLRAQLSPRASALGGAYSAIGNDAQSIYFNPAGFVQLKKHEISLVHVQWFEDIRMQNLSLAFKADPKLAVGLGFSYMGMPEIQGKDRFGQETEKLNVNSSILQLNIAYKAYPSFFVGMGLKYFRDNLAGYIGSGLAVDFGIFMETIVPRLTFAAAVQNLGNKIRYDQQDEALPLTYRLGLGYAIPAAHLKIAIDGIRSVDQNWRLATGLEFSYQKYAFLRIGNNWFGDLSAFQPAFGAGFSPTEKFSLDYTFYNHQQLGYTHRIGVSFRFGQNSISFQRNSLSTEYVLRPPERVYAYVQGGAIKVEWSDVPGAQYQVYVRKSNDREWVKAKNSLFWAHELLIKKPARKTTIDIAVSSIINGKESSLSRIVTIEIK